MDETLKIVFEESEKRIDTALSKKLSGRGITRSQIQKLILEEKLLVNGKKPKASDPASKGDIVIVHLAAPDSLDPLPLNFPLNVVYEDDDLFVVEKPSGMVTHPARGHFNDTLVNVLLSMGRPLSTFQGKERAGIVHRLDKETSGLLIVAKNEASHFFLSKQFAERQIEKEYFALVWGTLPETEITVSAGIGRDPKNRKKFAVRADGKPAVTLFREIERLKHISLVLAAPKTGRTHQLRVHLASIHHPIVGDALYGGHPEKGVPDKAMRNAVGSAGRFFLHSTKLVFYDKKGLKIEVHSPLPEDFLFLMETFGNV